MVLRKWIYLILILVWGGTALNAKSIFKLRDLLHTKDYKEFSYRIKRIGRPWRSYRPRQLKNLALVLTKRKRFAEAYLVYGKLMMTFHKREYREVRRMLELKKKIRGKLTRPFLNTLLAQSQLLFEIYKQNYHRYKPGQMRKARRKFYRQVNLLQVLDEKNEDRLDELEEALEAFEEEEKRKRQKGHYVIRLGQRMYKGKLHLIRESDDSDNLLISSARVMDFGLAYEVQNYYFSYHFAFHYMYGAAGVQSEQTNISYFQDGVGVGAYAFIPGTMWKFNGGRTAFGLEFPLMFRQGNFTAPTGFKFKNTFRYGIGLSLISRWMFGSHFGLEFSFGRMTSMESSLWHLGMLYGF